MWTDLMAEPIEFDQQRVAKAFRGANVVSRL